MTTTPTMSDLETASENAIQDMQTLDNKVNGPAGYVTNRHGVTTKNLEQILGEVQGYVLGSSGHRDFSDVAEVLADTTLTYVAAQPETVVAGDILRTRHEGFSYKVAATDATDHHVTTAGGVKLKCVGYSPFGPINVLALGVVEGDSSAEVQTKNVAILQSVKSLTQGFYFPAGHYYFNAGLDFSNKSTWWLTGDGRQRTYLHWTGTQAYGVKVGNHSGSYQEAGCIKGMSLHGSITTDNGGHATDVYGVGKMIWQGGWVNNVVYEDIDIRYADYGIHSYDTTNNWNRTFREVSMRYIGQGIYSAEANGNVLDKVFIFEFQTTAISISGFGIAITGCSIESTVGPAAPLGIYLYGHGFHIVGNYFEGVKNGISIDGSSAAPSRAGVIEGNYMVGLSSASGSYAVNLVVASGVLIQSNWFRNFDIGIRSDSTSSYNNIADPNFYNVNAEVQNGYGLHRIGQDGVFDFSGSPRMEIKARDRNFARATVLRTDWDTVNSVIDLYLNDGAFSGSSSTYVGTGFYPDADEALALGSASLKWANTVTEQLQMPSPDGSLWTLTVDNSGNLVIS